MPLRRANVQIRWDDDIRTLAQMDEATASSENGILLNQAYSDYRGMTVEDALEAIHEEADMLAEIASAGWDTEEAEEIVEIYREAFGPTAGLDPGVAGLVYTLSAIGATPISSCNGGLIGVTSHVSDVPHVLFTAPPTTMDEILPATRVNGVGIIRNGGYAEAFTDYLPNFHALARALVRYDMSASSAIDGVSTEA